MSLVDKRLLEIGYSFITMICFIFMGTAILYLFKVPMTQFHYPILPLLGLIVLNYIYKKDGKHYGVKKIAIYYILFMILSFAFGELLGKVWDITVDGRWYHSEAILRMVDGWNPVYSAKGNIDKWSYYYCKATWYFSAAATKFFGEIEKAKIYTVLFEITILFISIPFFKQSVKTKNYILPIIGAIILALNPVNWAQRMTFYQDAVLGILVVLLIMILFFIWIDKKNEYRKINLFMLFMVAAFLSNIKFTGLVYASFILFVFLITEFYRKGKAEGLKFLRFCIISFLVITIVLGFSPYTKNTIEEANPFYPLIGKDAVDIMSSNTPSSFRDDSNLKKFVKSLLLSPDNNLENNQVFEFKNLLTTESDTVYAGPDQRIRGFGLLSFVVIPLTLIMMLVYILKKPKEKGFFLMAVIQFFIISIVAGEIWWARYFSYFWLMPAWITIIYLNEKSRLKKFIGGLSLVSILINGIIYINMSVPKQIESSEDQKLLIEEFKVGNVSNSGHDRLEDVLNRNLYRLWIREKMDLPLQGVITSDDVVKFTGE